jgi:cell division protein FtsW
MTGEPSNYFYFLRQLRSVGIALVAAGLIYKVSIKFFQNERNMTIIAIILMVLQLAVFIPGLGVTLNGARGWVNIPLLPSIQPAELFKL